MPETNNSHNHSWKTIPKEVAFNHKDGDKYITYVFMEICECGVYRIKEYKREENA